MKEQWKFVGRSMHGTTPYYMWRCAARVRSGRYLWVVPVSSLLDKK